MCSQRINLNVSVIIYGYKLVLMSAMEKCEQINLKNFCVLEVSSARAIIQRVFYLD